MLFSRIEKDRTDHVFLPEEVEDDSDSPLPFFFSSLLPAVADGAVLYSFLSFKNPPP